MSFRFARVLAPALVAALMLPLALSNAAEPTTQPTGTITGKVVKEDGTPNANVTVNILPAAAGGKKPKVAVQGKRAQPVASTTTDTDGKFSVAVPAGTYQVVVGKRTDETMGRAPVTVTEGQTTDVTVTMKKVTAKPKADK